MLPRTLILLPLLATTFANATTAQQAPSGLRSVFGPGLLRIDQGEADAKRLAAACNTFAVRLRERLGPDAGPVSPGSVISALHLLLACTDGTSADHVRRLLELPAELDGDRLAAALARVMPQTKGSTTRTTNTIWVDNGFTVPPAGVLQRARSVDAQIQAMDFEQDPERARRFINYQVATATNGRIPQLLQSGSVKATTQVILTNTFWFRDAWDSTFATHLTKPLPFTLGSGKAVDVATMTVCDTFGYAETEHAQVVRLPFEESSMVFEIVLPKAGVPLAKATAATTAEFGGLGARRVHLFLPKFRADTRHDLTAALRALGLPEKVTATSGLLPAGEEQITVSQVVQQTWIAIDEDGAEAAAATAIEVESGEPFGGARQPMPVTMRCDRPFAFALRDGRNGLVWMSGEIHDPRGAGGQLRKLLRR